jgi:hypothetical protein
VDDKPQPWDENKIHKTHFTVPMMPWNAERDGYRIVEIKYGYVRSLFHGTDGSRSFLLGTWNKADIKMVTDGSHGQEYQSGWHFLYTREDAEAFFSRMFRITENRYVVHCKVRGHVRPKHPDGKGQSCFLADEILITQEDIDEAKERTNLPASIDR